MLNVLELKRESAGLLDEARSLLDTVASEKRGLTSEERETNQRRVSRISEIKELLQEDEVLTKRHAELEKIEERADISKSQSGKKQITAEDEVRNQAFDKYLRSGKMGLTSEEEKILRTYSQVDADGGFTIAPVQFQSELLTYMKDSTFLLNKVRMIPLSKAKTLTFGKQLTNVSDADWTDELEAVTADTALSFGSFSLTPRKMTKLARVSMDLLEDSSIDFASFVAEELGYKFGVTTEKAIISGAGTDRPCGIFNTAGITTARDLPLPSGNATSLAASSFDVFKKSQYRIREGYRNGLEWIMHRLIFEQVCLLKDGQGNYLYTPSITGNDADTINGKPVNLSEFAPSAITANAYIAVLGNLKQYMATMVSPFQIQRLNEKYADTNEIGFIGRARVDGNVVREEAFIRIKASAS